MARWLSLVLAVAIIVPFLIPADTYVTKVAAAVKQATGRDLKIAGPVSFHLLPDIALSAKGVSLSNAPGASDAEFVTIDTLDVGLKLIPLLSKKIEIDHLTLDQPVIHLEMNKQGVANWSFQPAAAPAPQPSKTAAPEAKSDVATQLQNLSLGTVKITRWYADLFRCGQEHAPSKYRSWMRNFPCQASTMKMDLSANADWNGKTVDVDLTVG